MTPDEITRFARHIVLPDVGGIGQTALLRATVSTNDPFTARFLRASGLHVNVNANDSRSPSPPPWWPSSPGDAIALALYSGAISALRTIATIVSRARAAHPVPAAHLAQIYAHALAAFPDECCGYLTDAAHHPCHNAAIIPGRTTETAFAIDGDELFALVRSFDGARPARVVYHSHTNGRAYFSPLDRETARAGMYPVQHLVVGVTATRVTECAQFAWDADTGDFVEVARWELA